MTSPRVEVRLLTHADDLVALYGRDFRDVLDVVEQRPRRVLTPNIKETEAVWHYELDDPVDDFTQLIFIVNRGLDQMLTAVNKHGWSTEQIDIRFRLDKKGDKAYEIKTSFPTLDRSFWLKIIDLRISVDPPAAGSQEHRCPGALGHPGNPSPQPVVQGCQRRQPHRNCALLVALADDADETSVPINISPRKLQNSN